MKNHFGSSIFSFKPSAIVTYSAGQWGGTRAAHSLRPILSELGCLPVSAMIHIPKAQDVLNENGDLIPSSPEDADRSDDREVSNKRWKQYMARTWIQLEWWGDAAKRHRYQVNPLDPSQSPALAKTPSQRNAPQ